MSFFSKIITLNFLVFLFFPNISAGKSKSFPNEEVYFQAQKYFHSRNYQKSLEHFESYIEKSKKGSYMKDRLFWSIDQVGYIYLRVQNNPDAAIKFFKKVESDERLNAAQTDTISEWLGAANDWKKEKLKPQTIKDSNKLFSVGKKYFDRGIKSKEFPADDKGNAELAIAETYLRPFIIKHDNHKDIGKALLMMGRIKFNLRTDSIYWSENFYLKEVIRRFPGSALAQTAWKKLNEEVRLGYTGSGGDHTPKSVKSMLQIYKELAYKK